MLFSRVLTSECFQQTTQIQQRLKVTFHLSSLFQQTNYINDSNVRRVQLLGAGLQWISAGSVHYLSRLILTADCDETSNVLRAAEAKKRLRPAEMLRRL